MNKGLFIWLIILIGTSLSGIVAVHFFCYSNPLIMNNEMFARIVNQALNKVVRQIEMDQNIRTIDEENLDDATDWNENKGEKTILNNKHPGTDQKSADTAKSKKGILGQQGLPDNNTQFGYQNWNSRRFVDTVRLKAIVDEVLKQTGIQVKFNYAIFSGDSIVQTDIEKSNNPKWHKVRLFPDDIFSRDLYLGICFPGTEIYLSHSRLLEMLTIIFILLILVTFTLGFFFIIRQKKLSVMKTDFINNMTHEFKTPITTIAIAADSILNEEVIKNAERVEYYTKMIRSENQRMNEQVERILQVARLDRKEIYFKFQNVNVHELIEDAIRGISIQIEKRGGRIQTKLEATNSIISTDPVHFTNLVHNLLDNANKYSPDAPEILVSTENDQKGLYIMVEDKGIGISKRRQTKIFDKFYRITSGNLTGIKGFGLGLSYIKAILKINKGNIKVYSEPGKGSRFVVFIPFTKQDRKL